MFRVKTKFTEEEIEAVGGLSRNGKLLDEERLINIEYLQESAIAVRRGAIVDTLQTVIGLFVFVSISVGLITMLGLAK
jgi:hypothetical protein